MKEAIYSSAIIDSTAELEADVVVGAHAIVGAQVVIGKGTEVGAGAQVHGPTRIGAANRIFPYACIGFEPQDLKYQGGQTRLEIGDRNVFREFCTVHRGTEGGGGRTTVGDDNLFMAYSHVAHDCHVGNRTIFSNGATLAGHVMVEDDAVIGAFSAVHQFCRIGKHAYIGGFSVITKDALPWMKTVGHKPLCYGLNTIGLERKGIDDETIGRLGRAARLLLRSGLNTSQAIERLRRELAGTEEIDYLIDFLTDSQRGVITARPGRQGSGRGGGSD